MTIVKDIFFYHRKLREFYYIGNRGRSLDKKNIKHAVRIIFDFYGN